MTVTKRTKTITIETRQRTVFRQTGRQTVWCEFCVADVEMTTPSLAASVLGISQRELFRRLENGNLHFFETDTGEVFICATQRNPIKE